MGIIWWDMEKIMNDDTRGVVMRACQQVPRWEVNDFEDSVMEGMDDLHSIPIHDAVGSIICDVMDL